MGSFRTLTASLGEPGADLDKALQLAGELEDEAFTFKPGAEVGDKAGTS